MRGAGFGTANLKDARTGKGEKKLIAGGQAAICAELHRAGRIWTRSEGRGFQVG